VHFPTRQINLPNRLPAARPSWKKEPWEMDWRSEGGAMLRRAAISAGGKKTILFPPQISAWGYVSKSKWVTMPN